MSFLSSKLLFYFSLIIAELKRNLICLSFVNCKNLRSFVLEQKQETSFTRVPIFYPFIFQPIKITVLQYTVSEMYCSMAVRILEYYNCCFYMAFCLSLIPRSMVCSEGSVGMPQNMMLVNMVQSSSEKQQDTRCTRVKVLQGGRLMTENQMWPSRKSLAVFMKNRLLEVKINTSMENSAKMIQIQWTLFCHLF